MAYGVQSIDGSPTLGPFSTPTNSQTIGFFCGGQLRQVGDSQESLDFVVSRGQIHFYYCRKLQSFYLICLNSLMRHVQTEE
jgi:hypothetical protein